MPGTFAPSPAPDLGTDSPLVRELEALSARAWPAATERDLDGWRLRSTPEVSRRANSVLPAEVRGRMALEERLDRVEAFYRERGQRPRFQISPAAAPHGLDAVLAERGYAAEGLSCVQIAELIGPGAAPPDTDFTARVSEGPDEAWHTAYSAADPLEPDQDEVRRGILARIEGRVAGVVAERNGQPAAVGLGVLFGGWVGIYCMVTHPEHRRKGAGKSVLLGLMDWARVAGAPRAYLQVLEANAPARGLYEPLGFTTLYCYHYRTL